MAIPALAILGASLFLKHQNDRAALKRQKRLASAMESFQRKRSGESIAATEELLKKQTPEARGTELADLTEDRAQSLRDTVGAAQAFDAPETAGKKGADFRTASEAEAFARAARTKRAIEQLAAIGAPGEQARAHGIRFGRAAGVVDASNAANEAVGRRFATDINNVRPNPFIDLVSQIGIGYGLGGFGGAVGGTGLTTSELAAADIALGGAGGSAGAASLGGAGAATAGANEAAQAARIRRQMQLRRSFGVLGESG